jgi:hypothetical protein
LENARLDYCNVFDITFERITLTLVHRLDALAVVTFVINGEANYTHVHLTLGAVKFQFVTNVLVAETVSQFPRFFFVNTVDRNDLMSSTRDPGMWSTACSA